MKTYGIWVTADDMVAVVDAEDRDYNEDRFFLDDDGSKIIFSKEDEAIEWLNDNIKPEKVYPSDRRFTKRSQQNYMR